MLIIIESLFFTNLWVLLYNFLLSFLNTKFPPQPVAGFLTFGSVPEPYEIPLYLVLTAIIIFTIFFLHPFIKDVLKKLTTPYRLFFLIFFGLILFFSLGEYPMRNALYPYFVQDDLAIVYGYSFLFFIVTFFITFQTAFVEYFLKIKIRFLFLGLAFLIIVFFVLEPRFPITWHDYAYFLGPVWEIASGKTIYTQIQSQYGFLSVILFGLIQKFKVFNFINLASVVFILYIVQYFLSFYLILSLSQSITLSILSLFSILTLNYFSIYHLPASIPQVGPMRWLPIILLIFAFNKIKKINSPLFIFLVALASFWQIDIGIAILLSYGACLFFFFMVKKLNFKELITSYLLLIIGLISIFALINLVQIVLGYKIIDIFGSFAKIKEYSRGGFGMIPMESRTYFWLLLLLYFFSFILFISDSQSFINQLLLLISNLSFFAGVYYVGRSHPHNLFNLSILFLLSFFIFISKLFSSGKSSKLLKFYLFVVIFLFLVAIPINNRRDDVARLIKYKLRGYQQGQIFNSQINELLNKQYKQEIKLINNNFKADSQIIILSSDDTYLFYLTEKNNLLDINPISGVISKDDLNFALKRAIKMCPRKIVVDCRAFAKCSDYKTLNHAQINPQLFIDRISTNCRLNYRPVECTKKLCIAVSQ